MSDFYIYCRAWTNFSETFPWFDELNPLPDAQLEQELSLRARDWLRKNQPTVRQRYRAERQHLADLQLRMSEMARGACLRPTRKMSIEEEMGVRDFLRMLDRDELMKEAERYGVQLALPPKDLFEAVVAAKKWEYFDREYKRQRFDDKRQANKARDACDVRRRVRGERKGYPLETRIARVAGWLSLDTRRFGGMWPTPKLLLTPVGTKGEVDELLAVAKARFEEPNWNLAMVKFGALSCDGFAPADIVMLERESHGLLEPDSHWTGTPLFRELRSEFFRVAEHLAGVKARHGTSTAGPSPQQVQGGDPPAPSDTNAPITAKLQPGRSPTSTDGRFGRLLVAKEELQRQLNEMQARWIDDGKDPSKLGLFGASRRAAELAATLGFCCPPVEYTVVRRPTRHALLDENPDWAYLNVFRVHEVDGLSFAEAVLGAWAERSADKKEEAVRELSTVPGTYELIDKILRSWCRAVESLNVHNVSYSIRNYRQQVDSLQMMAFRYKLAWALVGREGPTPEERAKNAELTEKWIGDGKLIDAQKAFDAQKARFRAVAELKSRPSSPAEGVTHPATEPLRQSASSPPTLDRHMYIFRLQGSMWELRFDRENGYFENKKGFRIISTLLSRPNPTTPFLAVDLVGGDSRQGLGEQTFQPVMDTDAKAACKEKREDLLELIAEANKNHDEGALERFNEELERLNRETLQAFGLGGRDRNLNSKNPQKRAQSAVGQRVREAIKEISSTMPKLGEHLKASIQTGTECAYRPTIEVSWNLEVKNGR